MTLKVITLKSNNKFYPENLKTIQNPPERLYILGNVLKKDELAIAIVGSRRMTSYGKKMAYKFSFELARKGITIVSGLALGIDTIAHKAAIAAHGRTIAVLGSGIDVIYPPQNKKLAEEIIKNGALISEFPLGTKPLGKNFLVRNRIISGLAKAILVVEGGRVSGTISTATWAANQGKEVFAIPGSLDSPMSQATNYLISQGANIATKPEDIIEILK